MYLKSPEFENAIKQKLTHHNINVINTKMNVIIHLPQSMHRSQTKWTIMMIYEVYEERWKKWESNET